MFEYLIGKITTVAPDYIVVDVNGIGFRVQVANPYSFQEEADTKVYVYQAVRDDAEELYGFHDTNEKRLFKKLINVSGIGPKNALAILANPDHQSLVTAIGENDINYLTKFPGIGKKIASRIVIELHDQADQLLTSTTNNLFTPTGTGSVDGDISPELQDALDALQALGYKSKDIQKVKNSLQKESYETTDEYLRKGLTILS